VGSFVVGLKAVVAVDRIEGEGEIDLVGSVGLVEEAFVVVEVGLVAVVDLVEVGIELDLVAVIVLEVELRIVERHLVVLGQSVDQN
jgi:hypothetical protein